MQEEERGRGSRREGEVREREVKEEEEEKKKVNYISLRIDTLQ